MRLRALVIVVLLTIAAGAMRQSLNAIYPGICSTLTPDNWVLYWLYSCAKETAGGGTSGAGD